MRILHLISSAGLYGAEAVVLNLLREMQAAEQSGHGRDHGMLAVFLNSGHPEPALYAHARDSGLETYLLPCRGPLDLAAVRALRALAGQVSADVVHAHGYKADVYTAQAARGSSWSFASTCHNWLENDLPERVYGIVDRLALRRAAAIVAVSAPVQQRLLAAHIPADRITLIPNGIRQEPFTSGLAARPGTLQRLKQAPVVGFAGRLSQEKGCDLFLQVARGILAAVPQARFLVAGDGPERQLLEAEIIRLGIAGAVTLAGRLEDMPAFYASIDLLLSTSRTEGMPIGLMEAMSSGLPVVATAVGDVPALVEEGVTGLLCQAGQIDALAAACVSLLRAPERAFRFGLAGAERVARNFSARQMTEQYSALYRQLPHNHAGGQPR